MPPSTPAQRFGATMWEVFGLPCADVQKRQSVAQPRADREGTVVVLIKLICIFRTLAIFLSLSLAFALLVFLHFAFGFERIVCQSDARCT